MNRIALSYVNPAIRHHADGTIDAHEFFHGKGRRVEHMQAAVDQMWRGGVRLVMLSHAVNDLDLLPGPASGDYLLRCYTAIIAGAESSERCLLVRKRSDLDRAVRDDKIAVVLHLTGAPTVGYLHVLDVLARLGVRACHPMHHDPAIGQHWYAEGVKGLTRYGKQLVREMEARHILVDVAHASDESFRDFLRVARKPVFDSHTACRALVNSHRNRSDAQMKAVAATGGVLGVHFASQLISNDFKDPLRVRLIKERARKIARFKAKHHDPYEVMAFMYDAVRWSTVIGGAKEDERQPQRARLDDVCDHLMHMIDVVGVEHVCIGSDYALGNICGGVETAAKLPNLVHALQRRGLRGRDLDRVLFGNLCRLLRESLPA